MAGLKLSGENDVDMDGLGELFGEQNLGVVGWDVQEEAFAIGVVDGRIAQAEVERRALGEERDARRDLLNMALL